MFSEIKLNGECASIISCSASNNQGGYHCSEAWDSITEGSGNGWAYSAQRPAWAIFQLETETETNTLTLLSGIDRNDYRLITFKVTVNSQDQWLELEDLEVISAGNAVIGSDSYITMSSGQHVIHLNFKPVKTTAMRLDVTDTDAGNRNLVLTEIYLCNKKGN